MRFPGPSDLAGAGLASGLVLPPLSALPRWRLFLPASAEDGATLRWSELSAPEPLSASDDWWELFGESTLDPLSQSRFHLTGGLLDAHTAAVLQRVSSGLTLWSAQWVGYGDADAEGAHLSADGEHWVRRIGEEHLVTGARIPQFCWDEGARFGWSSRLYPDSLIVSAQPGIARRMPDDPRLDLAAVMPRDILSVSAAD